MRPVERIDRIQELITKIWAFYPDMRYFQFVSYLADLVSKESGFEGDFFFLEDDKLEKALKKIYDAEYSHMRLREFNEFCG